MNQTLPLMKTPTPLMRQYWEIKNLHSDKILFFRMGDFYELFFEDAVTAAPLVGLTLTYRNKKSGDETPMCGLPHFAVAGPINKLLAHGFKVALCDQIEDPKLAKGLVKRAVTRILTPGMVFDIDQVPVEKSLYIASLSHNRVALFDSTTGDSFAYEIQGFEEALRIFDSHEVAELLLPVQTDENPALDCFVNGSAVKSYFGGPELSPEERIKSYLLSMGAVDTLKISPDFPVKMRTGLVYLSQQTLQHLEIFENSRGETKGSLFQLLNRASTPLGSRKLKSWLRFPTQNVAEIERRQNRIEAWILTSQKPFFNWIDIEKPLKKIGDIERKLTKLTYPGSGPRDLLSLAQGLEMANSLVHQFPKSLLQITPCNPRALQFVSRSLQCLVDDPPISIKDGHFIRRGVSRELDELIDLSTDAQKLLLEIEVREREALGISSLKVRYNSVFGYYIEVTHTHKDKIPPHYQRKQTLAQAERFVTDELLDLEKKIISSQEKRKALEIEIFEDLRNEAMAQCSEILRLSGELAELDAIMALTTLALEQEYTRPIFSHEPKLHILAGQHPVLKAAMRGEFVANNLDMQFAEVLMLTGPNMAGKSTLMRQTALMVLMAQIGSYVPAYRMEFQPFDSVYTRIGASDSLSEGLSTFMVEMKEVSEIIANQTSRSLVILDEVGRGTSTFDGLSLAQAILEHFLEKPKGVLLFATHYHELTKLKSNYINLKTGYMKVIENNESGHLEFCYQLEAGSVRQSYGIHVARLAGVPESILQKASLLLTQFQSESTTSRSQNGKSMTKSTNHAVTDQLDLF